MPDARTPRDLQLVDQVLTNVARQYRPKGYVYDQLAPSLQVDAITGKYPVFSGFFGDASDDADLSPIADRAETPEISFDWSEDAYDCEPYRLKVSITRREEANAHGALRLRQSKTTRLLDAMAARREIRLAKRLSHTGDGGQLTGGTDAPSNAWNTDAAVIESDIKTGALAVRGKIGVLTNRIVMDDAVAYAVALQQDIRDIIKYTVPGDRIISKGGAVLPPTIHGHGVVLAGGMRNTAKKGKSESLSAIWADDVRLLYVPDNPGWGEPAVAYAFTFMSQVVDKWRENDPPVEYLRAWEDLDERVTAPDAGYTITSVLS